VEPYYSDDLATVYLADCREVLPTLGGESIDFIFTDPPYGHNNNNNGHTVIFRPRGPRNMAARAVRASQACVRMDNAGISGGGTEVHRDANVLLIAWTVRVNIGLNYELIGSPRRCLVKPLNRSRSGRVPQRHGAAEIRFGVIKFDGWSSPPEPHG